MGIKISKTSLLVYAILAIAITAAIISVFSLSDKESPGKGFVYDLKDFDKTDPALVRYSEAGTVNTGFQQVSALAVDHNDNTYVSGDRSIRIFGEKSMLSDIRLPDTPYCMAISADKAIYLGMKDHIEIYNMNGSLMARWDSIDQNAIITSIAISRDNDVFVADAGNRIVLRYDASGNPVTRISRKRPPGFIVPSPYFDLAISSGNLISVVNPGLHRIETYTFDGDFVSSWERLSMGIKGFSGCCNPVNIAILPDGKFVTAEKGIPRVKVYSARGVFESVVAGTEILSKGRKIYDSGDPEKYQTGGIDIATDSQGRVLILEPYERVVKIFTALSKF